MAVVAIIQARMSSNRLPGKVLKDLSGKPVLRWVVDAACYVPGVDKVVVATSSEADDDPVATYCQENDIDVFRGSRDDVLGRMCAAAKEAGATTVMRLTADCPLLDPHVCAAVLQIFKAGDYDYVSNIEPAVWADGLDCEVVSFKALEQANREAIKPAERDHITQPMRTNKVKYKNGNLRCQVDGLYKEHWTLDDPQDYDFLQAITEKLPVQDRPPFYMEVLDVLNENPALRTIRTDVIRDVGTKKSVLEDDYVSKGYDKSVEFLERAEKRIPLGSQTFSKSKVQFPVGKAPLFLTHGRGGRSWDVDGNEYVDLVSALLPSILGYCDQDVDLAVQKQMDRAASLSLATELEVQLAEVLADLIPCAEMTRFGKNGTDATSAAIRLARAYTKRDHVIVMGYHGWQDWYIGSTARHLGVPKAVRDLTHSVAYNDLDALEACFKENAGNIAAVIMEPCGAELPKESYLQAAKDLTHKNGALLVFDEIITGFRVHLGGAQSYFGVTPDLACFGKAMANGLPLSAITGKAEIMSAMEDIFYSGTFGGETLSLAAALAVIDKIKREPVLDTVWNTGQVIADHVDGLLKELGLFDNMNMIGMAPWKIWAVRDHETASAAAIKTRFIVDMMANGVLVAGSHNVCYAHNEIDLAWIARAYEAVLSRISDELKSGTLEERLDTPILQPVFQVRKQA